MEQEKGCVVKEILQRLNLSIGIIDDLINSYQGNKLNRETKPNFFLDLILFFLEMKVDDKKKYDINCCRAALNSSYLQKLSDVVFGNEKITMAKFEVHQAIESAKCSLKAYCIKQFPNDYTERLKGLEGACKVLENVVCDVLRDNDMLVE